MHSIPAAFALLLCSCVDPRWDVDPATPPRAWTTHPVTKRFGRLKIVYAFHGDTVTAYVRPAYFPLMHYSETGTEGREIGAPGNWVEDVTFHGVTERYWGHFVPFPDGHGTVTVVPSTYQPNPANDPYPKFKMPAEHRQ